MLASDTECQPQEAPMLLRLPKPPSPSLLFGGGLPADGGSLRCKVATSISAPIRMPPYIN